MKQVYCNIQKHLLYTIYSKNIFETIIADHVRDYEDPGGSAR